MRQLVMGQSSVEVYNYALHFYSKKCNAPFFP